MGSMRFVSPSGSLSEESVDQAYLAGYDRIPWRADLRLVEDELLVERQGSESGNLYIPWHVNGHGRITLSTASLMDRQEPYFLPVELARGKLSQLRNQISEWALSGIEIPDLVHQITIQATSRFGEATCRLQSPAAAVAAAPVPCRNRRRERLSVSVIHPRVTNL